MHRTISGSRDGTIRVWDIIQGTAVTLFDTHVPVLSLHFSGNADRIMVKLERHSSVPLLCLHNSPTEIGDSSNNLHSQAMCGK